MANDITLSDAGKAVSALHMEMVALYNTSRMLSVRQAECVAKFSDIMRDFGEQQRVVARKIVVLENAMQRLLVTL